MITWEGFGFIRDNQTRTRPRKSDLEDGEDIWAGCCNEASVPKVDWRPWHTSILAYQTCDNEGQLGMQRFADLTWTSGQHPPPLPALSLFSILCLRKRISQSSWLDYPWKEEKSSGGWEKLNICGILIKSPAYRSDVQRGARNAGCKLSGAAAGVTHLFINKKTTRHRDVSLLGLSEALFSELSGRRQVWRRDG